MNEIKKVLRLAKKMRQAQNTYYISRTGESLSRAKGLEIDFDKAISELEISISKKMEENKGDQGAFF